MNDNGCKKAKSENFKFTIVANKRTVIDKEKMETENKELVSEYKKIEKLYSETKSYSFLKITKSK